MEHNSMSKKIIVVSITAFLLACNFLIPQTPQSTPEPVAPLPTESVALPTKSATLPAEPASQPSDAPTTDPTGITIVRLHPHDGDLPTMLAQEAQKATVLGQMPVAEFDATWCPPCLVIDEGLRAENELLLKAYAGTYIIKLDVDEWGWGDSSLHDFEFDGIPVYFKLDAQGQPTGEVIDGNAWGENIPENIAPPMDEFFHGK
jgi:thiol-disulfide isomerase/thioredoxin